MAVKIRDFSVERDFVPKGTLEISQPLRSWLISVVAPATVILSAAFGIFSFERDFFEKSQTELVHRGHFWPEKAVNNSPSRIENHIDMTA